MPQCKFENRVPPVGSLPSVRLPLLGGFLEHVELGGNVELVKSVPLAGVGGTLHHPLQLHWLVLPHYRLHPTLLLLVSLHNVPVHTVRSKVNVLFADLLRQVRGNCLRFEEVLVVGFAVNDALVTGVCVQVQGFVALLTPGCENEDIVDRGRCLRSPEAVFVPPRLLGNKLLHHVRLLAADFADLVHLDHRRLHWSL